MKMKTAIILNDIQLPYQDDDALNLVIGFIQKLKPDAIHLAGDIVDGHTLSTKFALDPKVKTDLQTEIDLAGKLMQSLRHIPLKHYEGGNHETRLQRLIWEKAPALGVVENIAFDKLFNLKQYGFQWHDYGDLVPCVPGSKLMVTHGDIVRKHSGHSAKAHFEKYGCSVITGHTHRGGSYYKTNSTGVYAAFENFCLCRVPLDYVKNPDWAQGFSVVHCDAGGLFHVNQIPILKLKGDKYVFYYGKQRISN